MKTNIIPCPINEKDLCSDTLFDDLFDNSEYVERRNRYVGFICGNIAKAVYANNYVHMLFEDDIHDKEKRRIKKWAREIEDSYNENLIDKDVHLYVRLNFFAKSCDVHFFYIIDKEED